MPSVQYKRRALVLLTTCIPLPSTTAITIKTPICPAIGSFGPERNSEPLMGPSNTGHSKRNLATDVSGPSSCNNECSEYEFCGQDLRCHVSSCHSFYQFGDNFYTGHDLYESVPPLRCETLSMSVQSSPSSDGDADGIEQSQESGVPVGVSYGCEGNDCITAPIESRSSMVFNEMCTAQPRADKTFVCYQFAAGTLFESFVFNAKASGGYSCPSGNHTTPEFIYMTHMSQAQPESVRTTISGPPASKEFDSSCALATFYARLEVNPPIAPSEAPTGAPTGAPKPNSSPTSSVEHIAAWRLYAVAPLLLLGIIV